MARAKRSEADIFTAIIEPDPEDGGYVVTFPALPDLATQGETLEEARWMAEDCLRGYLEVLRATNRALPGSGAPVPSPGHPEASVSDVGRKSHRLPTHLPPCRWHRERYLWADERRRLGSAGARDGRPLPDRPASTVCAISAKARLSRCPSSPDLDMWSILFSPEEL